MNSFNDTISLYQFTITMALILSSISKQNLFISVFIVFLLLKVIPEGISKYFINSPRPKDALNCNIMNKGGKYISNGFPSGHTIFSTFIFVYTVYEFLRIKKETGHLLWSPLMVTGFFTIMMPIVRVQNSCHSVLQVSAGFIYGIIWAFLFIILENKVLLNIQRYKQDKNRFILSFFPN